MSITLLWRCALLLSATSLGACMSLPKPADEQAALWQRVQAAGFQAQVSTDAAPTTPITATAAVNYALQHNPAIQQTLAQLSIDQAELYLQLHPNAPRLDVQTLTGQGATQLSLGLAFGVYDWLLLSPHRKQWDALVQAQREQAAEQLLSLAADVQRLHAEAMAAHAMSTAARVERDAQLAGAQLAKQMHMAGTLSLRDLSQRQLLASLAESRLQQALQEAQLAMQALQQAMGLAPDAPLPLAASEPPLDMPMPSSEQLDALVAAHPRVRAAEQQLKAAQASPLRRGFLGWLHDITLGPVAEQESSNNRRVGVSASIPLAGLANQSAQKQQAQAQLQWHEAQLRQAQQTVRANIAAALSRYQLAEQQYRLQREQIVPAAKAHFEQTQREANYMLIGTFELLDSASQFHRS